MIHRLLRYQLRSLLLLVVVVAIAFSIWRWIDVRYQNSTAGILERLRSDIAQAERLEVYYRAWFYTFDDIASLERVAKPANWKIRGELGELTGLGFGGVPTETIAVQIVGKSGAIRYFELLDSQLFFDDKYTVGKKRILRNEFIQLLEEADVREQGIRIRDAKHGIQLFTGWAEHR